MRREFLMNNDVLLFDGAMGTMLQKQGFSITENLGKLNITNPEVIKNIHREYIKAGAKVITTNTFGANERRLKDTGYTVEEIIGSGIKIAMDAKGNDDTLIAFDIGPIGEFLDPIGEIKYEEAYEIFKRQVIYAAKLGVDLILIETMMDDNEAKAAISAAKQNSDLPIFCTMTFDDKGRTFTGFTASGMVTLFEELGVDVLGINCSLGPKGLLKIVKEIRKLTNKPIMVQPNAGLPEVKKGQLIYNVTSDEFKEDIMKLIKFGATIVGGCCGTTPEYIRDIARELDRV